ncbi:hypothetical protein F4782DRAFT_552755 [Xylaria castorea]|nr:hypothetical protein F4782DRAFT_552755 [Xylaria castorea]
MAGQAEDNIKHEPLNELLTGDTLVRENNFSLDLLPVDEYRSLGDALHTMRRHFNIQDESLFTIEVLRDYISRTILIQQRAQPRVQLIHRISQNKMYLDLLQWVAGANSGEHPAATVSDSSDKIIDDMDIHPLAYVNDSTRERLQRRGSWFWKCRIQHMVSYHEESELGLQSSGYGRYMIDMRIYRELHKCEVEHLYSESSGDLYPEVLEQDDPPDDNFVYLTPRDIKGFSLKRKKWLDLDVDQVELVIWNKQAFKHLVIKEKTKRLIQASISNQIEAEKSTDLIPSKGNGSIMLLHGGPGTADVFLEQRSLEDLHCNALAPVFLRVLEYYDGILILTSNRVGTFDKAFKSRIQLALHCRNLSKHRRTQIWGSFLSRLQEINEDRIDFDDLKDSVEGLAKHKLNGREIRNIITTARQYVRWEWQQPNKQHIQLDYNMTREVIDTAGEFDRYIEKLNGGNTYDQLAEEDGVRLGDGV